MTALPPQFKPPFRYEEGYIFDADNHIALEVRGWGYLTGGSALNLPEDEAMAIHDQLAAAVVERLNSPVCEYTACMICGEHTCAQLGIEHEDGVVCMECHDEHR